MSRAPPRRALLLLRVRRRDEPLTAVTAGARLGAKRQHGQHQVKNVEFLKTVVVVYFSMPPSQKLHYGTTSNCQQLVAHHNRKPVHF